MPQVKLNSEQKAALDIALNTRDHLFITGGPGTGKSVLMEQIIRGLRRQGKRVRVAGPTGLAALALRGTTLARLLGTGIAKNTSELGRMDISRAEENLHKVTDLIVDEISMVSGDYLNVMDTVMREATGEKEPFGGIRIILCGDFLQLPPVHRRTEPDPEWRWAFQHPLFALTKKISLVKSMRQADPLDIKILTELRHGIISPQGADVMADMVGRQLKLPTELYPINKTVHEINAERLAALKGKEKVYRTGYSPGKYKNVFVDQVPIGERVVLKVGVPVIILANNPAQRYANGSQGVVVSMDFDRVRVKLSANRMVSVEKKVWEITDARGNRMGEVEGLPVHLGWAATIHRAQGMTLNEVKTDISKCFEPGQACVGMSRTRSLSNISLTAPVTEFQVDSDALKFMMSMT